VTSAQHIAQALVVRPVPAAPQSGTKIAHRNTLAPEHQAPARAVPPIQVDPQIRAKGKILTSPSAPILRDLLDNFYAHQSQT
jgi:hypothetical protein